MKPMITKKLAKYFIEKGLAQEAPCEIDERITRIFNIGRKEITGCVCQGDVTGKLYVFLKKNTSYYKYC